MPFLPKVLAANGRRMTGVTGGAFVLDGANQPTVWGGDISNVERLLTNAGAAAFFRVTFRDRAEYHSLKTGLNATAYLNDASEGFFAAPQLGSILADAPAPAINEPTQIDVAVKDAAGAYIDTAGIRINLGGVVSVG